MNYTQHIYVKFINILFVYTVGWIFGVLNSHFFFKVVLHNHFLQYKI